MKSKKICPCKYRKKAEVFAAELTEFLNIQSVKNGGSPEWSIYINQDVTGFVWGSKAGSIYVNPPILNGGEYEAAISDEIGKHGSRPVNFPSARDRNPFKAAQAAVAELKLIRDKLDDLLFSNQAVVGK